MILSKKIRFLLVGIGIFGAVAYLIFSGIRAEGVEYARVNQLADVSGEEPKVVKVTGKVQSNTLNYTPETPLLEFSIHGSESDRTIKVHYEGIKPDALREGGHVILEGKYDPSRNELDAHSLLAKCPSRYKSEYESYEEAKQSS